MSKQRLYWIADVYNTLDADNYTYRQLTVRFRRARLRCALKDVQEAVAYGDAPKEALEKASVVRAATGGTKYYSIVHGAEFTMRWQADTGVDRGLAARELLQRVALEPSEWYAPRVSEAHLHPSVAAAVTRLSKLDEPSPKDVLAKLRARPVVYVRPQGGLGVWVDDVQEPDLSSPLKKEQAREASHSTT